MQFKKIDPHQKVYHHFELEVSKFALYDDELDMPIVHGSRNLVEATVRKLSEDVVIIYYKRDASDKTSYKRKAKFIGGKLKPAP
jgi:hypothetical protein